MKQIKRYNPKQIERAEILVQVFIFLAVMFAVMAVFFALCLLTEFALSAGVVVGFLLTLLGAEISRDIAWAIHRHYFR